jgi:hypothetical protein
LLTAHGEPRSGPRFRHLARRNSALICSFGNPQATGAFPFDRETAMSDLREYHPAGDAHVFARQQEVKSGPATTLEEFHKSREVDLEPANTGKILGAVIVALAIGVAGAYAYESGIFQSSPKSAVSSSALPSPTPPVHVLSRVTPQPTVVPPPAPVSAPVQAAPQAVITPPVQTHVVERVTHERVVTHDRVLQRTSGPARATRETTTTTTIATPTVTAPAQPTQTVPPAAIVPEQTAPQNTNASPPANNTTPSVAAPAQTAPQQTAPQQAAPQQTAPQNVQQQPAQTAPQQPAPQQPQSDPSSPQ